LKVRGVEKLRREDLDCYFTTEVRFDSLVDGGQRTTTKFR